MGRSRQLHAGHDALIKAWADERCDELEGVRFEAVLAALRSASACEEACKCVEYMQRNRNRMRYAEFRAAGLCVGSGVVESGCKSYRRIAPQTVRDEMDRQRCQRHPLATLLHQVWSL